MRKDGSDHKHEWEQQIIKKSDDITEVVNRCGRCGLRTRKRQTQHPQYAQAK